MKQILLLLATISLPCIVAGDATQTQRRVLDTDGNELSSNSLYYVLTGNDTAGGALSTYWGEHGDCPLFVAQEPRTDDVADLVQFTPLDDNSTAAGAAAVHLSSDVSITFPQLYTTCLQGSTWLVTHLSPDAWVPRAPPHVAVGNLAITGDPPSAAVFRIEEHGGDGGGGGAATKKGYKLVSAAGKGLGVLDASSSKDRSWLAASDSPLVVVFKKGYAAHA